MRTVEERFLTEMTTAKATLGLVGKLIHLARAPATSGNSQFETAARDIVSSILANRDWEFISYDGVFLYVVVRFEVAVEQLVEKMVAAIPARKPLYADVPSCIRNRHIKGVAHIMQHPSMYSNSVRPEYAVGALADCLRPIGAPYAMVPQAFSQDHDNLWPRVLADIFARLGVKDLWKCVGRYKAMQRHLGTQGRIKITAAKAQTALSDIITKRNEVAHPGLRSQALGATQVAGYLDYLEVLVPVLRANLTNHLARL